jgi:uncharacterized protein involved in cysteine biosynthesis
MGAFLGGWRDGVEDTVPLLGKVGTIFASLPLALIAAFSAAVLTALMCAP